MGEIKDTGNVHVLHIDDNKIPFTASELKIVNTDYWEDQVRRDAENRVGEEQTQIQDSTYGKMEENGGSLY